MDIFHPPRHVPIRRPYHGYILKTSRVWLKENVSFN